MGNVNGKILLRQDENSRIYGFTKESEFDEFKATLLFKGNVYLICVKLCNL